jgi:ABC-type glycerol-3-phosphate transport system substrate-binding protein
MQLDDLLAATNSIPNYDDFFITGVENAKFQGNTHAILDFIVPGAGQFVLFNRPIFEAAGVPVPEPGMDMWGLAELARSVTDTDKKIFGFINAGNSILRTENNTRTWGNPDYGRDGDTRSWIVSADNKEFRYANNDLVKEYITTWLLPLVEEKVHPKPEDNLEGGIFNAGQAAMQQHHQGGPNRTKLRVAWAFNMSDYIVLPPGPDGRIGTSQETQNWYVGGLTKYPEQALHVLGFFTGREAGLFEILEAESGYSGRFSVWTDPAVLEYSPVYADGAELLNTIVEPGAFPWNLRWAEFNDAFTNLHRPLAEGEVPWDEQAPVLQRECDAVFAQPMLEK